MAVTVSWVPFGPGSVAALAGDIGHIQGDDPLAPVTVIVGRGALGLATRRWLASGAFATPGRPGICAVRFLTPSALAEELAGARLSDAQLLGTNDAVIHAAVRAVLSEGPGPVFGPVAEHPATIRSLVGAYRDLRQASSSTRRRLAAQSARAAEVVRLTEAVRARLVGFFDDADLFQEAAAVATEGGAAPHLGHLIWYLPLSVSPDEERLLAALSASRPVSVLVGATGADAADETAKAFVARLDGRSAQVDPPPTSEGSIDLAITSFTSAPTADVEVLNALRLLSGAQADGMALERTAIVYAGAPYPRLVREMLEAADIPFNGSGQRPLSGTVAGRTLLGLFALVDGDWARHDVIAWLAGAPVNVRRGEDPVTEWDRISREAGVIRGLAGWAEHLTAFRRSQREHQPAGNLEERSEESARRARRARQAATAAADLQRFVEALGARFEAPPRSWSDWSAWAQGALDDFFDGSGPEWPPGESEALSEIRGILLRLSTLDRIEPQPDQAAFRSALSLELEAPAPQTTRFGRGVLVGRVAELVGLDLDLVIILGMCDGAFPVPTKDDPTLPDEERAAAGGDLPLLAGRDADHERDYRAALASTTRCVLSYARADQGSGRELRPSRWWLDALGAAHGGGRLYTRDLEDLGPVPGYQVLASFHAAVAAVGEPASPADYDLRSLLWWREQHATMDDHFLVLEDPVLSSGLRTRRQRRASGFSRFEGAIDPSSVAVPSPATGVEQSATGLETYARCPRRYFFERVLRVTDRPQPEAVLRISALDRGSLVHEVLERFIDRQQQLAASERIGPETAWSPEDHQALDGLIDEVGATYEQVGLVGRRLLWQVDQAAIRRDLHEFLRHDDAYRRARRAVPEAVELGFPGPDGAVSVELSPGRRVAFKGLIDRVDRTEEGSLVVLDYKTGRKDLTSERLVGDPVERGTRLQLPIYALAARRHFGDGAVDAYYWYVSQRGGFEQVGHGVGPEQFARFVEVLGTVVDGIESGSFPGRPGKESQRGFEHCRYCPFDAVCPTDRGRAWDRNRQSARLAAYVALAEPDDGGSR